MLVHSRLIRPTLALFLAFPLLAPSSTVDAQTAPPPAEVTLEPAQAIAPKNEDTFKGPGQARRLHKAARAAAARMPAPVSAPDDGTVTCLAGCDGPRGAVVYRRPNI